MVNSTGLPKVHRAGELRKRDHAADDALDEVVLVAEGKSLGAVTIYCDGLASECLHYVKLESTRTSSGCMRGKQDCRFHLHQRIKEQSRHAESIRILGYA